MTALDLQFIDGQRTERIMLIMTLSSSIQELISSQMTDLRHYNTGGRGGMLGVC